MHESPNDSADLLDALRLNLISGIGPRMQQTLLEVFETPAGVLSAPRDQLLQVPKIGAKLADAILAAGKSDDAQRELDRCGENGFHLIPRGTPLYPSLLEEICDPPVILYSRGQLVSRDGLAVAIVGSRRCTIYGRQQTEKIAGGLARAGITIVSGLARGIDAVAHRAALEAGGRTIAVAATGLATVYPPEHAELATDIAGSGAVITECPLDQAPVAGLFPQRNRIISGMSLGVIVIEANRNSGALYTCRHAMEQGREVMAVPGRIDSLASEGCHDLIRDGVTLIRHVDDVLEALGPLMEPITAADSGEVRSPRELTLTDQEREILNLVTDEPQHLDQILRESQIASSRAMATLTVLEVKRMIRRLPGNHFVRAPH